MAQVKCFSRRCKSQLSNSCSFVDLFTILFSKTQELVFALLLQKMSVLMNVDSSAYQVLFVVLLMRYITDSFSNGVAWTLEQIFFSGETNHAQIIETVRNNNFLLLSQLLKSWTYRRAINIVDVDRKWSPLMYASNLGHFECVKLLVEANADLEIIDAYSTTALMLACKGNLKALIF